MSKFDEEKEFENTVLFGISSLYDLLELLKYPLTIHHVGEDFSARVHKTARPVKKFLQHSCLIEAIAQWKFTWETKVLQANADEVKKPALFQPPNEVCSQMHQIQHEHS